MSLDSLVEQGADMFAKCFGHAPRWKVAAPGRVNLIGEHTDYNDGFVLPMAIDRYTFMAADRNTRREVTLHSVTTGETASFSLRTRVQPGQPAWSNYVRGVVAGFQERGLKLAGFDGVIDSSVPFGGGVSSSAALEVAAATLIEAMSGQILDPIEKALLCQQAEHKFAGVPCGIMDQFTSVLAREDHALLLDCRSRTATPVRMNDPLVTVLVVNSNVRHKLVDGVYASRRKQCEAAARALNVPALRDATMKDLEAARSSLTEAVFKRARHVITENERTLQAAQAIQARDWPEVGQLMYKSHASLRDDYEVSCPELDAIVEIARAIPLAAGMIGCRMTGAGFGGCAVCLVRTEHVKTIARKFEEGYEVRTGNVPAIFSSRPAGGARILA
ncbi:MAG TPA: galactokinase [Verrucomicrobiae bacterium]|nr:galactokinase [Verrucomicrobiae bacterium]